MNAADKYVAVIGLEVHAQMNTLSKAFSSDPNSFGTDPNQNVSVISLGHPGSLPKLNGKVIESAIKLGLATGSGIARTLSFARKNYFYTDLPKGYQISQHESPVCEGGHVLIRVRDGEKKVRLTRIHIEEDAGKSLHRADASHIDLNRAGVPLLEIVTEPDISSGEEAHSYLGEIRRLVRYLGICDGNMEEGSLRCDANVSVKLRSDKRLGTRTEIKNLNSMSNVRKAVEYEIRRQTDLLARGEKVIQQTRSFDDQKNLTFPLRSKEEADDYRYFPEPDLNPYVIKEEMIARIREALPALPMDLFRKFTGTHGLAVAEAEALVESRDIADYYEKLAGIADPKTAANWILGPVKSWLNENNALIGDFPLDAGVMGELIRITRDGLVSYTTAQQKLFPALVSKPDADPGALAGAMDLLRESDEDFIMKQVVSALDKYPEKVEQYNKGKKGLLGLFMGEVMKSSKGKADPGRASELMVEELNKRRK